MKAMFGAVVMLGLTAGAWAAESEEGFVSLFDGKTLDGWKIGDNAALFTVVDGTIVMECPASIHAPAHLYYDGPVANHSFKNFDLKVDVMTFPKANSGIYFHTQFQEAGWPKFGIECQVNNSHVDWRRSASLWGIRNVSWGPEAPGAKNKEEVTILPEPAVKDNQWYTEEIVYQNGLVTTKLNGKTMVEYRVADADSEHKLPTKNTWLPRGTFALQGHPPMPNCSSKAAFKNIRVKVLAD